MIRRNFNRHSKNTLSLPNIHDRPRANTDLRHNFEFGTIDPNQKFEDMVHNRSIQSVQKFSDDVVIESTNNNLQSYESLESPLM